MRFATTENSGAWSRNLNNERISNVVPASKAGTSSGSGAHTVLAAIVPPAVRSARTIRRLVPGERLSPGGWYMADCEGNRSSYECASSSGGTPDIEPSANPDLIGASGPVSLAGRV